MTAVPPQDPTAGQGAASAWGTANDSTVARASTGTKGNATGRARWNMTSPGAWLSAGSGPPPAPRHPMQRRHPKERPQATEVPGLRQSRLLVALLARVEKALDRLRHVGTVPGSTHAAEQADEETRCVDTACGLFALPSALGGCVDRAVVFRDFRHGRGNA